MAIILTLHGIIRWLVLAGALAAVGDLFMSGNPRRTRVLGSIFLGLLDLQLLLGIVLIAGNPRSFETRLVHLALMLAAVVAAHGLRLRARRAPASEARRLHVMSVLSPVFLLIAGLAVL